MRSGFKQAFTLVELLVVLGILALLMATMIASLGQAKEDVKIQAAVSEVKAITQALLAAENLIEDGDLDQMEDRDLDKSSLGMIFGQGERGRDGNRIPVLLMGKLGRDGKMRDPWNTPYKVSIRKRNAGVRLDSTVGNLQTGYYMPNFYRLSAEERK